MSKEKIKGIIQLRYFKLMFPDINEDGAEIVANILADALIKAEHEFIVKK